MAALSPNISLAQKKSNVARKTVSSEAMTRADINV